MAFIDYYKVMGIPKDTPQDKIKEAYRKRSKQFHPDLHPDDPKAAAKFKLLNEANEVLSDPEKRRKYDQYGENWKQADQFCGFGAGAGGAQGNPFGDFHFDMGGGGGGFSDFFEQLFGGMGGGDMHTGGRGRARHYSEPREQEAHVTVDAWTAMLGGEIVISAPTGKFKLKIEPGTQPGKKMRMRGKGGQLSDGSNADLILVIDVAIPTNLNAQQRELIEQARRMGNA